MSQISNKSSSSLVGTVQSVTPDAGGAVTPDILGNINIVGTDNINTAAAVAPNTIEVKLDKSIAQPVTNAAGTEGLYSLGGDRFMHNYGTNNTFVGRLAGDLTLTTAQDNTGLGSIVLNHLLDGNYNTAIGSGSQTANISGSNNTSLGAGSLLAVTGGDNTALGTNSSSRLVAGARNVTIGELSGFNYTGAETDNILIGMGVSGVLGESNVTRIGVAQNKVFIDGITGVTPAAVAATVAIVDSSDQLGSLAVGLTGQVLKGNTAANPSWGAVDLTTDVSGLLPVGSGGTGVGTLTDHGVLVGSGVAAVDALAVGATGQTLMGNTANDPSWTGSPSFSGTATAGTGLTATTGNITVSAGNLLLPTTTATAGQVTINGTRFAHAYGTDNTFIGSGAGNLTTTGSTNCVALGNLALASLTIGDRNNGIGSSSLNKVTQSSDNIGLGTSSLSFLDTGNGGNVAIGNSSLISLTTGEKNTSLGTQSLYYISTSASYNIAIGYQAGISATGTSSSNIYIGNVGANESNKMRLGTTGSGNGQVDATYIAGIYGVTPGGTKNMCIVDSNGQMGSAALPTPFEITWAAVTVNTGLVVNSGTIANKAGLLTMTLPATAAIGDIMEFTNMNTAVGTRIAQNANQYIRLAGSVSTTGVGGYVESTAIGDSLKLVCVVAGASTVWFALSSMGNWTIA